MPHSPDPELDPSLDRMLAGEPLAGDAQMLRAWASGAGATDEEIEQLFDHQRGAVTTASWAQITQRLSHLQDGTARRGPASSTNKVAPSRTPGWRMVSALCVGIAIVGLWSVMGRPHRPSHSSDVRTYRTAYGQRTSVRLADGSVIVLAPGTSVTDSSGTFNVSGEAYFAVTSHQATPFIVRTQRAVVRVLGTRFMVRQYPGDVGSRVVVDEGRVMLQSTQGTTPSPRGTPTILSSRTMAMVTDSGVTVTTGVATREYIAWTQGTLVFNHVPLRDVVTALSRAYGVSVQVDDSVLAMQKVIAEVAVDTRPLVQILDAITLSLNAHYVQQGTSYLLVQGRRAHAPSDSTWPRPHSTPPEKNYGR